MKRNFFKKLSFVLASAMVLTTLAPASGALAAGGPKLNSTKKYLHLGRVEEGENEFNFNVSNKGKGWKYKWTSANEDVAKVNKKNGVATATGVGSTKVTVVITDKDGEELEKLTAKVTVRDNIETVKISNLPTEAIAVGEEKDFNRSYVTESGNDKKTSGVTRWEVTPDTATINDKGVFVATEAGEYTITANSFQSKSKYTAWLASEKKDADLVTATASEKVTVASSMVEAKQVDKDTVKVTFSSTMTLEDVKKNLTLSEVVGSTKVLQTISEIKLDDTGKVAEVSVYVPFDAKEVYVIDYTDLDPVQFVAATTEATDVATVKIGTTEAEVGKETDLKVKLYNADGVDITTDDLLYRVTYDTSSASSYLSSDDKLTIFTIGETTVITAEYHTYNFNSTTGEEIGNIKVTGVVKCVDEKAIIAKGITAWTIESTDKLKYDFNDVKHSIAADDANKRLLIKSVLSDDNDTVVMNDDTASDLFTFTSSNENVVMIDPKDGDIYAIKAGSSTIVVKYDDKVIGTVTVSVGAERKAVNLTLDTYAVTISNSFADTKTVKITVKDQFGEDYGLKDVNAEVTANPTDNDKTLLTPGAFEVKLVDGKTDQYIINAKDAEAGTYRVKITANGMSRYVVVTVKTPDIMSTGSYYRAEVDNNSLDLKLASDDKNEKLTISVYHYDKKGVRIDRKDASTYSIEVKNAKGVAVPGSPDDLSMVYVLASAEQGVNVGGKAVSGAAIKLDKGTYTVTAKDGTTVINKTYFTVTDTQTAPTFVVSKLVAGDDGVNVLTAVKDCFKFTLRGEDMKENVVDVDAIDYGERAYIKTVTVREYLDTAKTMFIDHEVKVNTSISW